jgi:hypothetical protein
VHGALSRPEQNSGRGRMRKDAQRLPPLGDGFRSLSGFTGEPERLLLAVADLAPHAAFFPAHLAPPFAFPHSINGLSGTGR